LGHGKEDISEFVKLTRPHHRQLYGIALSLCRDPDQAQDLTQEALIKAYQAFDRFRSDEPILPWLRRILRNVYLDTFKTGRARHEVNESGSCAGAGRCPSRASYSFWDFCSPPARSTCSIVMARR
jgi:RNA polymerase sigma factor (sigma-70 family)